MKQLIEDIIKALVDDKAAVKVTETGTGEHKLYETFVAKTDLGKVIGKNGQTIMSIRRIVNSASRGRATFDLPERE